MAAGLHCLLELPPGADETRVMAEAARLDLRLEGLTSYLAGGQTSTRAGAMVIGYGAPSSHTYDAAISAAARAVRAALG
jgi:GntR family transcriptional regulator / MocR family aminotransferase